MVVDGGQGSAPPQIQICQQALDIMDGKIKHHKHLEKHEEQLNVENARQHLEQQEALVRQELAAIVESKAKIAEDEKVERNVISPEQAPSPLQSG